MGDRKNILIFGGTGYLGKQLVKMLNNDYDPIIVTRQKSLMDIDGYLYWDYKDMAIANQVPEVFAVINLTGAGIAEKNWTKKRKEELYNSRILPAKSIVKLVNSRQKKPAKFVQGSAIGFYKINEHKIIDETGHRGQGFLSELVYDWEKSVSGIDQEIQLSVIRTGLVVGNGSPLIKRMRLPFSFFMGGRIGTGNQIMSWIHIKDWCRIIHYILDNDLEGVFNATAPNPVSNKTFSKALGKSLNRPAWFPLPGFILKFVLGEMAESTVLAGQNVIPARILDHGFVFDYECILGALE